MKQFIYFADLPPSPIDDEQIKNYIDLGFNYVILTEDNVKLLDGNNKLSKEYIHAIEKLGSYNLNVLIRNMYNDKDYFDNNVESKRSNYGSEYVLTKRLITDEFSKFSCVKGFYMADEPFMKPLSDKPTYANFEGLQKLVNYKNKYYPNLFFHMNMVPSSSFDHYCYSGEEPHTYIDFIQSYIDNIICKLESGERSVCLDNYPFIGENYIEKDYLLDLLTVSILTKKYNDAHDLSQSSRFGICIQTFFAKSAVGDGRKRDICSSSEVSFQLFSGLATGASLFEYFCYRSYEGMPGILNMDGTKRIFDLVKEANDLFMLFEHLVAEYEWIGSYYQYGENIYQSYNGANLCGDLLFTSLPSINIKNTHDVLVGVFAKDNKFGYLILNFTDPIKNISNKVNVIKHNTKDLYFVNGKKVLNDNSGLVIELKAGEAAFIE